MLGKMMGLGGNPLYDAFDQRRNTLMGVGAGLLSGNWGNMGQYAMQGRQRDDAYATQQKAEATRQDQMNKTVQAMLEAGREDLANMAESGFMEEAWRGYLDHVKAQNEGTEGKYGLTPIWGVGPDGQPALGQLNTAGGISPVETPEGFQFGKDPIRMDAGTHWVLLDPVTRQQIGSIPKENEQAAYDTAVGSGRGKMDVENEAAIASLSSKMPGLKAVVGELKQLAQTATYTAAGQVIDEAMRQAGMEPSEAAIARSKYTAMIDNQILPLLRDTFGAQFTQQEGEALRATLGDPNKHPAEKVAILEAFIAQKERDLEAMYLRQSGATAPSAAPSGQTSTGIPWSVEP